MAEQEKLLRARGNFLQSCSVMVRCQEQQALRLLRMHTLLTQVLIAQTKVDDSASRVSSLSTDWGIIFPLTMTALKCRMGSIRKER